MAQNYRASLIIPWPVAAKQTLEAAVWRGAPAAAVAFDWEWPSTCGHLLTQQKGSWEKKKNQKSVFTFLGLWFSLYASSRWCLPKTWGWKSLLVQSTGLRVLWCPVYMKAQIWRANRRREEEQPVLTRCSHSSLFSSTQRQLTQWWYWH